MTRTTTVILGGGQAGLAASRCLSDLGLEHVVLERGRVAERWRSSWESLRLLTPNWMTRLPGREYDGADPDGFMAVPELLSFFERYAAASAVPLHTDTTIVEVARAAGGFRIVTTRGDWFAPSVVVATGYCDRPAIPAASLAVPPSIRQIVPASYRRPEQLPAGRVLIVGASSTGVQLADEIQRSGRDVTLAVGRHTRLPRTYRGRDIMWWLDRLGVLSQRADAVPDIEASRRQPSLQLIGRPNHASIDLAILRARGVRLAGRLVDIDGARARFADDLITTTSSADIKMAEILARIDRFINDAGIDAPPPEPFEPMWPLAAAAPVTLNLKDERFETIIWATGYRRVYPWLQVPVLDSRGEIRHQGGVTPEPGLYVLGLNFQRQRNSSFIQGIGDDACAIARAIALSMTRGRVA
jgi:putative flavoprotein involved in K+ transport